jgi:ankyrin repeat protein
MKRSLGATDLPTVRPVMPATSDQREPEAQQVLAGLVADAPIAPVATEDHAPMAFPGPFAHVPRPPAMQHGEMQASPASTASSGQDRAGQAAVVQKSVDASHGKVQDGPTTASGGCSTSTTAGASAMPPVAIDDNPHGLPPLILAASKGRLADLDVLLQDPATDINQIDSKFGGSALMVAAGMGRVDILARLIARGAYIDLVNPRSGMTAMMYASRDNKPDALACLLEAGAQVNLAVGPQRMTALMMAVLRGNLEVVQMLVKRKGVALDQMNALGQNALHLAAGSNEPEVVKCLLAAGAQVNLGSEKQRQTALMKAAQRGHVEVMNALLARRDIAIDATDALGVTALHWAANCNKPDAMACLLAAGASKTLVDAKGKTALELAIMYRHAAILEVLSHYGAALPDIDHFDPAHAAYTVTLADLAADLKLPADPQQNPLGLVAPAYLEQPVAVIDELVAVLESGQDLLRWLRAKGIRMAGALPVVECLAALASTWPALANNRQAASAQQKRLVCAAALSRLSVLTGKGKALERYKAAGISAAGLERLSAVATRQIEKMIAVSEQVLTTFGSTRLDKLMQDCLAKTSFTEVDTDALGASLVRDGWLAPLAQAIVRAWTAALATLEAEPLAIAEGSTVKQVTQGLRETIERKAPRLFAQAMQRELAAPALLAALRTWIGGARAAEGFDLLFQIQCDQFRQYCEQLGNAG